MSDLRNSDPSAPIPHFSVTELVVPPIISSDSDRQFLIGLNADIDEQLEKVKDKYNHQQRYTVYKSAFNKVIDFVTAYKPLLTAVKAEYEECIDTICLGQKEAFFLSGKLKAMASEPSTMRNYRKRIDELEQRTKLIDIDNKNLEMQLNILKARKKERENKEQAVNDPPVREIKRDPRNIPGLTNEESTDLKRLVKEKEKLERQYRELCITHRTRYVPKSIQVEFKEKLALKVLKRDQLINDTEFLRMKQKRLKTAVEAANAYMKAQPPHQTIGDAVVSVISRQGANLFSSEKGEDGMQRGSPGGTFEEDDPTKEKEAEMMLEYIEKFNELLEDYKYEDAAVHAANSPKGILRTPESLQRFKDITQDTTSKGRSPVLAFCDALMSSVPAFGSPPNEFLSLECIRIAFIENRIDLVSHWISQERITFSKKLGDLLYEFSTSKSPSGMKCLPLAQKVYARCKCIIPTMVCMVQQNRVAQAIEFGKKNKLTSDEYIEVLKQCPDSLKLVLSLYSPSSNSRIVPIRNLISALIENERIDLLKCLFEEIQNLAHSEKNNPSVWYNLLVEEGEENNLEKWGPILQKLHATGHQDIANHLLGMLTVKGVIDTASVNIDKVKYQEIVD